MESPANVTRRPASCSRASAAVRRRAPQAAAAAEKRQWRRGVSPHVANSAAVSFVHLRSEGQAVRCGCSDGRRRLMAGTRA